MDNSLSENEEQVKIDIPEAMPIYTKKTSIRELEPELK